MQTELAAADGQGSGHVVAVAHEDERPSGQISEQLLQREEIREGLTRMVIIRQAVDDRAAGVGREHFDCGVAEGTQHDGVDVLDERVDHSKKQTYAARLGAFATPLRTKLEAIRDSLVEVHSHVDQITLHYPIRLYNMLLSLADMVQSADGAPTKQEGEVYRDIAAQVSRHTAQLRALETNDVVAFNRMMRELDVPAVVTGR